MGLLFRWIFMGYNETPTLLRKEVIMPYAIQVRTDNLDFIKEFGHQSEFNLEYIEDNMEYNALDGENTYMITDGNMIDRNVTFTEMTESGFRQSWKFVEPENPNQFVKIERV